MIPRLKSSHKWTSLPPELCTQISDVFSETFASEAKIGKFVVEGRIYGQELLVRVGYLENGRLRQVNFEVSIDFNANKQNALELIHFAIDCAASFLQEYFAAEGEIEQFPRTWKAFTIDKKDVFIQVTTVNTHLEAEADRLLGKSADDLVQGDDETDLILDDDETDLILNDDE